MKAFLLLFAATLAFAHPMGNFSVSHYARLEVDGQGIAMTYVLDLAEIPTFDLLRSWQLERNSARELLEAKAREQAKQWLSQLQIRSGSRTLHPKFLGSELAISDGAGNLPVARITVRARVAGAVSALSYEDPNFPDRAGWKEIVITSGKAAGKVLSLAPWVKEDPRMSRLTFPAPATKTIPMLTILETAWWTMS